MCCKFSSVILLFISDELKRKRQKELCEYKKQLDGVENERELLEKRGVELEQTIRKNEPGDKALQFVGLSNSLLIEFSRK